MRHILRYFTFIILSIMSFQALAQTAVWRDVYEVKKKDTIYGISRAYGITIDELMDANPEMKSPNYKLKKGTKILIPNTSATQKAVVEMKQNLKTAPHQTIKIGIMLPLHNNDGDGKRMVEYYRGILMGCDSLKAQGINTEVYAWNVPNESDIKVPLINEEVKNLDIIFGPLYTKQVKDLADYCQRNDIKLVIPFSIYANDVQTNKNVFQVYQNGVSIAESSVKAFMERFPDCNPIIIDCNDSTSNKGVFTTALRKELESKGIHYQITNLRSTEEQFAKAFSASKKNVIVLNTGRSPELNMAFRKLNELKTQKPTTDIAMFGYVDWLMYEQTYRELFHKYDAYIPSTYYYNKTLTKISQLERNYKYWFKTEMQNQYIPRFAITGFDHAMFFIRGLYDEGSAFNGKTSSHKYIQTPLRFARVGENGGLQNNSFLLVHYKSDRVIETIAY